MRFHLLWCGITRFNQQAFNRLGLAFYQLTGLTLLTKSLFKTSTAKPLITKFNVVQFSLILTLMVAWPSHAAQTILVFGDSLSAAYGLEKNLGWVELLAQRVQKEGYAYQVVNASISGETSAGGLSRINNSLKLHKPDIVVVELGANDGLRGLPVAALKDNLSQMIHIARQQSAQVVLVGIQIPPNYGLKYAKGFSSTFDQLAKEFNTSYVPFLLAKVAGNRQLNQNDGIHPTAAAQPILLNNVWPHLKPLLKKAQ